MIVMNNHNQKGLAINIHTQTDTWIYRSIILLGLIVLMIMSQSMPETFIALGTVAAGGLAKLLIPSPLN